MKNPTYLYSLFLVSIFLIGAVYVQVNAAPNYQGMELPVMSSQSDGSDVATRFSKLPHSYIHLDHSVQTFNSQAINPSSTLLTKSIPADRIGPNDCVHGIVSGSYLNNSGGNKTIQPIVTLGNTIIWSATTGNITTGASPRGLRIEFDLCNNASTSLQTLTGVFMLGPSGATIAGIGALSGMDIFETPFSATPALNTTNGGTLTVSVLMQNSASSSITLTKTFGSIETLQ